MDDYIIKFDNVSYSYEVDNEEDVARDVQPTIKNVSLGFAKGKFTAVLGRNGSGKSTIAKLCNGILVPSEGKVTVSGMDTSVEELTYKIRKRVGMVFQNPDNQIVATIVEDDVAFGPENLGVEPKEIRRRVDEALKTVEMYELRDREPHKLSGGQKQRVAIAGILAMKTECIVLDEPTAMLDPGGRAEVLETIKRLNKEEDISVILITHFMDEAVQADRVIVIDDGKVAADGIPAQVFANRRLISDAGLDIPQAAQLSDKLKENGINLGEEILNADDCAEAIYKLFQEK